jgi:AraC-like DNA-binding protein
VVRTLIESVAATGVPHSRIVRAARLEPDCLQTRDARLPRSKLYELVELALDLTSDPAFGLHSVERLTPDALNPIAAIVVHAATLQEAMRSIQEFRRMLGQEASFRVQADGAKVFIEFDSLVEETLRVRRFMTEVAVLGLFRIIQRFRTDAQIDYAAFEYAAPDYAQEYARIFEDRVRFEQPFTGLCYDSQLTNATAPHRDAEPHQAVRVFATRRVRLLTDKLSYAARVRDLLVWHRPQRDMTMQDVARELGTSVRSLRRRLIAEGKTYAGLVSEAQTSIAKACLLDEQRTIQETAFELGFADVTSFHRAFKRWTGFTPAEYRRQQLLAGKDAS